MVVPLWGSKGSHNAVVLAMWVAYLSDLQAVIPMDLRNTCCVPMDYGHDLCAMGLKVGKLVRTHARARTCARTNAYTRAHALAHTRTRTHMRMHTHTHTSAHTHTTSNPCTHTRTHTRSLHIQSQARVHKHTNLAAELIIVHSGHFFPAPKDCNAILLPRVLARGHSTQDTFCLVCPR